MNMRKNPLPALLLGTVLGLLPLAAAQAADDVLIVYDASGSMWGQIDGVNKIVTAREVMADLVQGWPEDTNLGLVAYGHRSAGDCADIETLVAPQPVDRQAFINTVNAINPKGKTPIADSLRHAANVLQYRDNNATVVLISDGLESCHGDPCAVAAELEASGVDFTAHVVGFDLDEQGNQALACIADNTGGIFVPASNADELKSALQQVQARVVQKEPELEQPPEPEPAEPEYDVGISAPEQITAGARFDVSWTQSINNRDWVQIVPAGHPEGKLDNYIRVENKQQGQLTAPGQAGMYEVRYVLSQGGKTLAHAPVEVLAEDATLDFGAGLQAPAKARPGETITVSWSGGSDGKDQRVTLAKADAADFTWIAAHKVGEQKSQSFTLPDEAGRYEVRYLDVSNTAVLGRAIVEVK